MVPAIGEGFHVEPAADPPHPPFPPVDAVDAGVFVPAQLRPAALYSVFKPAHLDLMVARVAPGQGRPGLGSSHRQGDPEVDGPRCVRGHSLCTQLNEVAARKLNCVKAAVWTGHDRWGTAYGACNPRAAAYHDDVVVHVDGYQRRIAAAVVSCCRRIVVGGVRVSARQGPDEILSVGEGGYFGPVSVIPQTPYEFRIQEDSEDARPVHYFFGGFIRSDKAVYLRTLPAPPSLAAILLSSLPEDDAQTVLIVFSSSRAVVAGRDNLVVDGLTLSTEELASQDQTSIAFFLYDTGDLTSSGEAIEAFVALPFLMAVDWFLDTALDSPIHIEWNDKSLNVPRIPSGTEGPAVILLD